VEEESAEGEGETEPTGAERTTLEPCDRGTQGGGGSGGSTGATGPLANVYYEKRALLNAIVYFYFYLYFMIALSHVYLL